MTATTMKDVSTLLETMLQEKTLSLEAMDSIRKLKERADKADQEIAQLTEKNRELNVSTARLQGELSDANIKLGAVADREKAVQKREDAVHQLEMKAAVAQAESNAYRTSMSIVFAPNVVRESIMKYGAINGGNGVCVPTSDSGIVTHTEGYARPGDVEANNTGAGIIPKNTL